MRILRSMLVLTAICLTASSSATAQDYRAVRDGVEYAEVKKDIGGVAVNLNLLRLDLSRVRLDVIHANDSVLGTETTSSIVARKGSFAGVNGGFFRLDKSEFLGDPVGMMVIDGNVLSEPTNDRIQLMIDNKARRTEVAFGRSTVSESIKFGNRSFPISGIDRERKAEDVVVYTPEFGNTTLTKAGGVEIVILRGRAASISSDLGNSVIPRGGYVVSASGPVAEQLKKAAESARSVALVRTWDGLPAELAADRARLDVIAGAPQLIHNGRIDITWEQEHQSKAFVETRHPRTAAAKLKDGRFVLVTVDGRSESSGGIGLQDLAEYLLSIGAVDAINLDGGGSTTMVLDGRVVNHPSDKEGERKVSDAIVVTPRAKR